VIHWQIQYEVLISHAFMLRCEVTKILNEHTSYIFVRSLRLDLLNAALLGAVSPQHDMILFAEPEDRCSSEQMHPADSSWASN
jgi:hypothetical protein